MTYFSPRSYDFVLERYLIELSRVLTGDEGYTRVFRVHNKQLQTLGDLSFQVNIKFAAWKSLHSHISEKLNGQKCETIFDYASIVNCKDVNEKTLPKFVSLQPDMYLKISKCKIINSNCHIFLERTSFMKAVIKEISDTPKYHNYRMERSVRIESLGEFLVPSNDKNNWKDAGIDLSSLRLLILQNILSKFAMPFPGVFPGDIVMSLTTKSSENVPHKIVCGCVLNAKGRKEDVMTSSELFERYATNMRMVFEHKWGWTGPRKSTYWRHHVSELGQAAVIFQMIQNSTQKPISLASEHHVVKDASFVLYNAVRINKIVHRFHTQAREGNYPSLPPIEDIDFANLRENEEWTLIFAFLAQFPSVIEENVKSIRQGKIYVHKIYAFLVQFATVISGYYSRVKVFTEPKEHMFATLHARIQLLSAIDRVMSNALLLLDIEPIDRM